MSGQQPEDPVEGPVKGPPTGSNALTGWVVFRLRPWHVLGIFGSSEEADLQRARAGADYQLAFGTADPASGAFDGHDGQA